MFFLYFNSVNHRTYHANYFNYDFSFVNKNYICHKWTVNLIVDSSDIMESVSLSVVNDHVCLHNYTVFYVDNFFLSSQNSIFFPNLKEVKKNKNKLPKKMLNILIKKMTKLQQLIDKTTVSIDSLFIRGSSYP